MYAYEQAFSLTQKMIGQPFGTWHTTDFEYTDPDGNKYTGAEAYEKHIGMYTSLLSEWFHEPALVYVNETPDGYSCFGHAMLFASYKVPGEKTVTDMHNKEWEFKVSRSACSTLLRTACSFYAKQSPGPWSVAHVVSQRFQPPRWP
jgi:hypothetical protein